MNNQDSLIEWNRLNKENAEQDITSALFSSMAKTSPIADTYSMWLFAGTGATGSLLITQINTVLPNLTNKGFKICLLLLIISAFFAFCAKYNALRCQIQMEIDAQFRKSCEPIFSHHEESEKQIKEIAEKRGIQLETEIEFQNVIKEFKKPFPFWVGWLINRSAKNSEGNRQAGYHNAIKSWAGQLSFTFLQSLSFIGFLFVGCWFASSL